MAKSYCSINQTIRELTFSFMTLVFTITVSFGQESKQNSGSNDFSNEWWYPIIQKHQINMGQFNYRAAFRCINASNVTINNWLELGTIDVSNDKYVKLKNAVIIVMFDTAQVNTSNGKYWILSSPGIQHDFERNIIDFSLGKLEWFEIKNKDIIPVESNELSGTFNFNAGMKIAPLSYKKFQP